MLWKQCSACSNNNKLHFTHTMYLCDSNNCGSHTVSLHSIKQLRQLNEAEKLLTCIWCSYHCLWFSSVPTGEYQVVDCIWNVMAHVQKSDFVFWRNGRVYLNRQGRQFSRLLTAELCASVVVMLDTPCSKVVWSAVKGTGYPLHLPVSPSLPLLCVTVCHHVSNAVYLNTSYKHALPHPVKLSFIEYSTNVAA